MTPRIGVASERGIFEEAQEVEVKEKVGRAMAILPATGYL